MNCPYCSSKPFKSARGLTQHQQSSRKCFAAIQERLGLKNCATLAHAYVPFAGINNNILDKMFGQNIDKFTAIAETKRALMGTLSTVSDDNEHLAKRQRFEESSQEENASHSSNESDADHNYQIFDDNSQHSVQSAADSTAIVEYNGPDYLMLYDWRKYCTSAPSRFLPNFTKAEADAIELLVELRKSKASLNTYERVMKWHFKSTGQLKYAQTLSDNLNYIPRKKIFEQLRLRYNYKSTPEKMWYTEELLLPHSKAKVTIVLNDPKWVIQSLLTDPRITDSDYIFDGNSPLSPPRSSSKYIRGLSTGLAYKETYKVLITDPTKQILLPVIFYIDAANTGQFVDLPLTAVKISLGIFTQKARDKDFFWGTLGYIPGYCKHVSRGRKIVLESGHMSGVITYPEAGDEEEEEEDPNVVKAQDLQAMLAVILRKYIKLQETGFIFDLFYNGHCYEEIEFKLFTPFLKLDSDEAEKLCGKYTSRSGNVKCLCRYCVCPTADSDKPYARHPPKTTPYIQALVNNQNLDELRNLSQQNIQNAMYKIRFGSHNDHGIHGACPMEMLNAMLLGIFRYVRDCFFEQVGPDSGLADDLNSYAMVLGDALSRQSQRDLPRTRFPNGIRKGKLNAKDFPGILLCMACTLRCTGSRNVLRRHRGHFKTEGRVDDWLAVVETLLQWEMWLKHDRLRVKHVKFAREKHRYIMYLIKKVGNRTRGMGLKITKFHCIMHMADDILNFGVPMEFDTGSNESGHKVEKTAAKLTQKNKQKFDQQTCERLEEVHLLDLAVAEMQGHKKWEYYQVNNIKATSKKDVPESCLGGTKIRICVEDDTNNYCAYLMTRGGKKPITIEQCLVDYIGKLQEHLKNYYTYLSIYPNYTRKGHIFRASTKFMCKAWRDWAIIDWGEDEGNLPCHLMGFIDLSDLPDDYEVDYRNYGVIGKGIFAIVEVAQKVTEEDDTVRSELFVPYAKEVGGFTGKFVSHNKYYLADVEAIVGPAALIPDIDGPANHYLYLKDRAKWRKDFERWLEKPSEEDIVYSSAGESDAEDRNNYAESSMDESDCEEFSNNQE